MPVSVDEFKAAFKVRAQAAGDVRWGPADRFWQSQTSLKEVVSKIDALDKTKLAQDPAKLQAVVDEIDRLPDEKKTKYKDALDGLKAALDDMPVTLEPAYGGVNMVKTRGGTFAFVDGDGAYVEKGKSEQQVKFAKNVLDELASVSAELGVDFDDIDDLVKSILFDPKNGANSEDVDGSIWELAIKEVKEEVVPKIKNDLKALRDNGLVGRDASLKGIKFTGSDFHKGGKQVLILRMEESGGKEKKVVYKPANLEVDRLLFGDGGLAETVGGISSYKIVTGKNQRGEPADPPYGYMEFVDTEGGPKNATDVLGLYKSTAAAMAMAYYVGLEDVHNENVIAKKNSLQVIDMEATTGMFSIPDKNAAFTGGFLDQQWGKAINQGLKGSLVKAIEAGKLTAVPVSASLDGPVTDAFRQAANGFSKQENAKALAAIEKALAGQKTRIVPIETRAFQEKLIPLVQNADSEGGFEIGDARKKASFTTWCELVDAHAAGRVAEGKTNVVTESRGQTTNSSDVLARILKSPGTYAALKKGDVPYYSRDLGSSKIFDELGNEIDGTGHKKVGTDIKEEMKARRTGKLDAAIDLFVKQGLRLMKAVNEDLEVRLAAPRT